MTYAASGGIVVYLQQPDAAMAGSLFASLLHLGVSNTVSNEIAFVFILVRR